MLRRIQGRRTGGVPARAQAWQECRAGSDSWELLWESTEFTFVAPTTLATDATASSELLRHITTAPGFLGLVHDPISGQQQRIGGTLAIAQGDTDRDPHLANRAGNQKGRTQRRDAFGGYGNHGVLGIGPEIAQQDHELITADARQGIAQPYHRAKALRHLTQDLVTGLVPEGVIDSFEAIEVHEQQD